MGIFCFICFQQVNMNFHTFPVCTASYKSMLTDADFEAEYSLNQTCFPEV